MSKILVTGGAGAIGSRLVRALCAARHDVLVLDDLSSGWHDNIADLPIRFWRGSVGDDEILKEVFSERPSVVYHLAANFANQNSVDYPQKDLLVNGMGTLKVLQHSLEVGVKRFVYSSSSCVYGNSDGALSENMVNSELDTPYAITKLLGEHYVNFFHEHHSLPTVILRFFNSYGPGEYPGKYRNVIPNFMYRMLQGAPIVITGTGEETRDFTFVDDTVAALILSLDGHNATGKTFNVGTGVETPIIDLVNLIAETCGKTAKIEFSPPRSWDGVKRRRSNISHIQSELGYIPRTQLRNGLKEMHRWLIEKRVAELRPLKKTFDE